MRESHISGSGVGDETVGLGLGGSQGRDLDRTTAAHRRNLPAQSSLPSAGRDVADSTAAGKTGPTSGNELCLSVSACYGKEEVGFGFAWWDF